MQKITANLLSLVINQEDYLLSNKLIVSNLLFTFRQEMNLTKNEISNMIPFIRIVDISRFENGLYSNAEIPNLQKLIHLYIFLTL